jgi:hypothetical protein
MAKIQPYKVIRITKIPPDQFKIFKGTCAMRGVDMSEVINCLVRKVAEGDVALLDRICK